MTFPEFDAFFDEFVAECRMMRDSKGKEYANSESRFGNFNRLSAELGISPAQIGMVYARKHIDSVQSFLKTGKIHSNERIRGRFIDIVTYMILIAGMVEESEQLKVAEDLAFLPSVPAINEAHKYVEGLNELHGECSICGKDSRNTIHTK